MPRAHRFAVSVLCLSAFTVAPRAQDQAAFDQAYSKVKDLLTKQKWADAKAGLDALLTANEKQLWVLAERENLVEDYRRCCFALEVPAPKPEELIKGELQSWSPSTGKIKLHYVHGKLDDWKVEESKGGDLFVHPAAFKGDYSVTLRGDAAYDQPQMLLFDVVGDASCVADFGAMAHRGFFPVRLLKLVGNDKQDLLNNDKTQGISDARYTAMLKVTSSRIQMFVGELNKAIASVPRPKGPFGQVAFIDHGVREIDLEGIVEPSWFQNLVDTRQNEQRATFDQSFEPKKRLPAWLFVEPSGKRTEPKFDSELPSIKHARPRLLQDTLTALQKGDWAKMRAAAEALPQEGVPPVLKEFLLALAFVRAGQPEDALPHVDAAQKLEPDFTWTRALRAQCFETLRRHKDAQAEYEQAIAADPGEPGLYDQAVGEMLRHGQGDLARALVRKAKVEHGLWEAMLPIDRLLTMLERGPQWPRRFHAQSANYDVWSDIDQRTCQQACTVLEESLVNLKAQLTWIKDDKALGRFRVFLFSGEAGYTEYCKQILGSAPSHTAGLYSPVLKQLLIWNLPKREDMEKTIRHEGFHQFLDRALIDPPAWFNEGMAEFWETARREKDRFTGGQVRNDHIATLLRSRAAVPKLKDFVYAGRGDFYANAQLRYAQGWALVHFLRKGPAQYQKLFPALWEALRADSSVRAALDKSFAGVDWQKLDADFWAYLPTLK